MKYHVQAPLGIQINFRYGCHIVFPACDRQYHLRVTALHTGKLVFDTEVKCNPAQSLTYQTRQTYFIPWRVEIFQKGQLMFLHDLNLTGRQVCVDMRTADRNMLSQWLPSAIALQNCRNPRLSVVMDHKFIPIFRSACAGINLLSPEQFREDDFYAVYPVIRLQKDTTDYVPLSFDDNDPAAYSDAALWLKSERKPVCLPPEENFKFSICVPMFNEESGAARCIESVLNQTYKNWELLICNDKSTDSTLNVLKKYEQADPRIHVIDNKTNKGSQISRITLFRKASGEYCVWGDGDDVFAPDFLEQAAQVLLEKEYDIVEFPYELIFANRSRQFVNRPTCEYTDKNLGEFFFGKHRPGAWYIVSKVIRTSVMKRSLPPEFREVADDVFFALPLFYNASSYKFCSLDHPMYTYFCFDGYWSNFASNMTVEKFSKLCQMRDHEIRFNVDFMREKHLSENNIPYLIQLCDIKDLPAIINSFRGDDRQKALDIFKSHFGKNGNLINDYPLPYDAKPLLDSIESLK